MNYANRILIIEDEPGIVAFLKQGLEEEGYAISVATDGKTGLELLKHELFDLALIDWNLPELPGIEICEEIRKENTTLPILFLTARDAVSDVIDGLKAGANDYIKKPFHFEELVQRIAVQLRNKQKPEEILTLGTIEVNKKKYTVFKDQIEIYLTQKEFDLLVYLIENKGKVCARTAIIEDVWDIHFDYDSGIIDVYMNAIRKKLHISPDEKIIQTVRGVGFIANEIQN